MTSLDGKVAIVAGAGPGIGRACATALRREGADVVVAARDAARLDAMAFEMTGIGPSGSGPGPGPAGHVVPIAFDFADLDSCRALVDVTLNRLGRIDILVNVATAGGETGAIAEGEWESWRRAFEVNVIGTMELSRLAAHAMGPNPGGSITQVGTIGTRALPPGRARYTATKSAMVAASLTMAKELGRAHVRVNIVTPGFVTGAPLDAMVDAIATRNGESVSEVSARMTAGASLRRHVDPDDVAEAVVFLAGPGARNITGIELPVTAGR
jgi:NAD(P)-dependent dehydrogenase (short-subunit alcohol dehydrogenase family)